jgi:hypothetical protein
LAWPVRGFEQVSRTGRVVRGTFVAAEFEFDADQRCQSMGRSEMNLLLFVVVVIVGLSLAAWALLRSGDSRGLPRTAVKGGTQGARVQQLRRSLMSKAMGDKSKVDAWVEYERGKAPSISEEECYARANERWERDNR